MLYEVFDSLKQALGDDHFTSLVDDEIVSNLNPKFELREYQKEALGRFEFYFSDYRKREFPAGLLFHMATGSGKTFIMAANILQLYKQGYRNFIFFVNSTNIIEKTKDNFLNSLSSKYLFAPKIKFGEREVQVREVQNFESTSLDDINIVFTTIQGLHTKLNYPKENALTYEDFEDKEIVLISDEAHHINTLTKSKLTKSEEEEKRSWEYTVERIFRANQNNILLEFTATIDLRNVSIREKYENKIIFQYDLKQFRLDKYSKEIEVLEADLEPIERALQAVILSQYRRKIAEKYKLSLKPVILFKANYVNPPRTRNENTVVSKEFKEAFLGKIKNLQVKDIDKFRESWSETIQKAFAYFDEAKISTENLIREIQNDFDETKCLSVDSSEEKEEKQILVNSLEAKNNEIRAVFAVEMLNEGWDVLNLFDIVRLYNTRDARGNKPGPTTMAEAQLIGRGARYFPFMVDETQDVYRRKYDDDIENELRILEQLFYHSAHNPRYIQELKSALTEIGIYPEKYIQRDLFIKESFKESEFWKKGFVFFNERVENPREDIFSLDDAGITNDHKFELKTGESREEILLGNEFKPDSPSTRTRRIYRIVDFGEYIVRAVLDKLEFYQFVNIHSYFPHLKSISEFISSEKYLGDVRIEVLGHPKIVDNLSPYQKVTIALSVLKKIQADVKVNTSEYVGTKLFKVHQLKDIFHDKVIKIDKDDERAKGAEEINLAAKDWYAQNELYGTSEEKDFVNFLEGYIDKIKDQYDGVVLLRNEKFLKIFDFDEGRAFEPDFLMLLQSIDTKGITVHQVFIEPKGNQFKDSSGGFEDSKEGWKQKFLLVLENKAEIEWKHEDKNFKLLGLPFYNDSIKQIFEEAFENKILN